MFLSIIFLIYMLSSSERELKLEQLYGGAVSSSFNSGVLHFHLKREFGEIVTLEFQTEYDCSFASLDFQPFGETVARGIFDIGTGENVIFEVYQNGTVKIGNERLGYIYDDLGSDFCDIENGSHFRLKLPKETLKDDLR